MPSVVRAGSLRGQAFVSLPRVSALNVGWVACNSLASRSTKATATVDLLAARFLSCLQPERCEEGAGGSLPAGTSLCQALARTATSELALPGTYLFPDES